MAGLDFDVRRMAIYQVPCGGHKELLIGARTLN